MKDVFCMERKYQHSYKGCIVGFDADEIIKINECNDRNASSV